jgi:asperthecin polyketide synthase
MFPTKEVNMYAGDVCPLAETIVGMMGQIKFRRIPLLLMNLCFFAAGFQKASGWGQWQQQLRAPPTHTSTSNPYAPAPATSPFSRELYSQKSAETKAPAATVDQEDSSPTSVSDDCLKHIAREAGLEPDQLTGDASFVQLGVDSLMSLVLSEKFCTELHPGRGQELAIPRVSHPAPVRQSLTALK